MLSWGKAEEAILEGNKNVFYFKVVFSKLGGWPPHYTISAEYVKKMKIYLSWDLPLTLKNSMNTPKSLTT